MRTAAQKGIESKGVVSRPTVTPTKPAGSKEYRIKTPDNRGVTLFARDEQHLLEVAEQCGYGVPASWEEIE